MTPAASPPSDPTAAPPRAPLWLLALITFSGTLAMHIFVPALPEAAEGLDAAAGTLQLTISLYILGLAVGQLFYGPLSDRFGRRPVLLGGLCLYTLSGIAAALAPGAGSLIAARLFQAFGGCAGLVLGRAMVRDTSAPEDAARRLALMNLMVTLGPGFAPLIGGLLVSAAGWRSVLYALVVIGFANLVCAWRLLPETGRRAGAAAGGSVLRHYRRLFASRAFLGYAIGGGCATTSMYAFIAAAPFIMTGELHRPPHEVGIYLGILISGVWLGSMAASRLIGRVSIDRLMVRANLLSVAGALVFLATTLSGMMSVTATVGAMFVFTLGVGMAAPAALTKAIGVDPRIIGSASGLYGFTQMAVGALCTSLAGLGSQPALAAALVLAAAGLVGQIAFAIALGHERRRAVTAP
ncbi:multidrug effflux MFS transporter [Tistrella mobilis]|uniref:multidrug effflux MFS transporter n=1 Tax=Tistrella mobilis TaxID=171437 RepID=UPI003558EC67